MKGVYPGDDEQHDTRDDDGHGAQQPQLPLERSEHCHQVKAGGRSLGQDPSSVLHEGDCEVNDCFAFSCDAKRTDGQVDFLRSRKRT